MDNTLEVARMALLQAQEQQQRDAREIDLLRGAIGEIVNTLRANLECHANSYANRELYRELLAIAEKVKSE